MIAALSLVLAQTCTAMLPAREMELEWVRNGRPFARDVPVEATATSRSYRRTLAGGGRSIHTVACSGNGRNAVLTATVASETPVRLPVLLEAGGSRTVDRLTIRRISPPGDGAPDARWFSVAGPLPRIYGVRSGAGIVEMRVPSANGGIDVYRAFLRRPPPPPPPPPAAPVEIPTSALEAQIGVLQSLAERLGHDKRVLEDSVRRMEERERAAIAAAEQARASLRAAGDSAPARTSPVDERLLTMLAVDVFMQRGEFNEALDLLRLMQRQIASFEQLTGHLHPGSERVADRIEAAEKACDRAKRLDRSRRCGPRTDHHPYAVADIIGLLQGGLDPSSIAARAVYECIAFAPTDEVFDIFRALGATPELERALRGACTGARR